MSTDIITKWTAWEQRLLSVLRIIAGFLFMQAGTMKLFGYPISMPPEAGPLELISLIGLAGILETFGGALIILGLFTRPVAFILSGLMAVAYFIAHASQGFWPLANGGVDAVFYCFLWLYFSASGGGAWSFDALRLKKSR